MKDNGGQSNAAFAQTSPLYGQQASVIMTSLKCPIPGCLYETPESSEKVACALLAAHSPVHTTIAQTGNTSRGPKLDRPTVDVGINQEQWNIFVRRWDAFTAGSGLDPSSCSSQLFQCAGQSLGDSSLSPLLDATGRK